MSADARVWMAENSNGWFWAGVHDGPCKYGVHGEEQLSGLLNSIEDCLGGVRWVPEPHELHGIVLSGWTA